MVAYFFDPQTAQHWLDILQPIQVGYGAVLLSFLGAIHWGLEFAGMGGHLVQTPLPLNPNSSNCRASVVTLLAFLPRLWLGQRSSSPQISH